MKYTLSKELWIKLRAYYSSQTENNHFFGDGDYVNLWKSLIITEFNAEYNEGPLTFDERSGCWGVLDFENEEDLTWFLLKISS